MVVVLDWERPLGVDTKARRRGRAMASPRLASRVARLLSPSSFLRRVSPTRTCYAVASFTKCDISRLSINGKTYAPVNLDRIAHWVEQGRLVSSPDKPITARELVLSGCIHNAHDGVKLLGNVRHLFPFSRLLTERCVARVRNISKCQYTSHHLAPPSLQFKPSRSLEARFSADTSTDCPCMTA